MFGKGGKDNNLNKSNDSGKKGCKIMLILPIKNKFILLIHISSKLSIKTIIYLS